MSKCSTTRTTKREKEMKNGEAADDDASAVNLSDLAALRRRWSSAALDSAHCR